MILSLNLLWSVLFFILNMANYQDFYLLLSIRFYSFIINYNYRVYFSILTYFQLLYFMYKALVFHHPYCFTIGES